MVKLANARRMGRTGGGVTMIALVACMVGDVTHSLSIPILCLAAVGLMIWLAGMVFESSAPTDGVAEDRETGIRTLFRDKPLT